MDPEGGPTEGSGFWRFLPPGGEQGPELGASYDPFLIGLSFAVAALAGYAALEVVERMSRSRSVRARRSWLAAGAVAMGSGVWAMHFIGMLALTLPVPVSYDLVTTLVSMLPAVFASAMALHSMDRREIGLGALNVGALFMALGIGGMHYTGMEAMRMEAMMDYEPRLFVLSLVVAHVLGAFALYIKFVFVPHVGGLAVAPKVGSALAMGGAVAGMHYTAMAAARFHAGGSMGTPDVVFEPFWIGVVITLVTTVILGIAIVTSVVDRWMTALSQSLEESDVRYRLLVEHSPEAIAVHQGGRLIYVNPAAVRLVRARSAKEILGRPMLDFVPPELRDTVKMRVAGASAGRIQPPLEEEIVRLDGSRVEVETTAIPVEIEDRMAIQVVMRDVSEQKELERDLRRREANFRSLVEHGSDLVTALDLEGRILYQSPAVEDVLGYVPEDVEGRNVREFVHPEDLPRFEAGVRAAIDRPGTAVEMDFRVRRADEGWSVLEGIASAIAEDGTVVRVAFNSRDVTARREMQARLERALADAQKSDRLKTAFLANVSHEIRTPLNVILGYVGVLSEEEPEGEGSEERREILRAIERSGRRLTRTVHDILDISQIEAGTFDAEPADVRVGEVIRQISERYGRTAAEKGVELSCEIDVGNPILRASEYCFTRIVENLVDNAVKFTSRGSVRITATRDDEGSVRVAVRDTGIGIAESNRKTLFEPFSQVDPSHTRAYEGSGLGLALSRRYAELCGAQISVESVEGEGSTFTLVHPEALRREGSKPAVLVLEDHADTLRYLSTVLADRYRVVTATNAAAAWARVEAEGAGLRAVITDVALGPGEDGIAFARALRARRGFSNVPVVVATAYGPETLDVNRNDYDAWLTKPFPHRDLLAILDRLVTRGA